jgi:hypothetical protein
METNDIENIKQLNIIKQKIKMILDELNLIPKRGIGSGLHRATKLLANLYLIDGETLESVSNKVNRSVKSIKASFETKNFNNVYEGFFIRVQEKMKIEVKAIEEEKEEERILYILEVAKTYIELKDSGKTGRRFEISPNTVSIFIKSQTLYEADEELFFECEKINLQRKKPRKQKLKMNWGNECQK